MRGLSFQSQKPVIPGSPNRMDVACFVGLVDLRDDAPREDINQWLYEQSWLNSAQGFAATYHRDSAEDLLDVPVPIESWERFTQLFEWNQREFNADLSGAAYLATAVRAFFAQGGRRCYVVRVASPLSLLADETERHQLIANLVPGFPSQVSSITPDRSSWAGVGHLLGLPDVTMLCLPDLPDLVRITVTDIDTDIPTQGTLPEQFVVCSDPVAAPPPDNLLEALPAPTSDAAGFSLWGNVIHQLALFLSDHRRDVQLIAAIPLPDNSSEQLIDFFGFMHEQSWFNGNLNSNPGIASAFVQLCYPWLRSAGSDLLPQHLEPPDGSLAGLLARNAITRGAFRSVTALNQRDVRDIYPALSQQQQFTPYAEAADSATLIDRVSLFGHSLNGVRVLSDVTTSDSSAHRPANINRIISMVVRSARLAGEEYVFESNGERLWSEITQRLNDVLRILFDLGALRGEEPEDAFFVRCDKTTMSQQDLDSGRVIVEVEFNPAASIESIAVILSMQQSGQVSLKSIGIEQAVA
ncbi:MAG: phage tail sheath family protein [Gammaproteobacteria bacterium]|nr:phage tail sheath family protein [Gammaproteobacteria bacterium]